MTGLTIAPAWPEPYIQPDRSRDCGYYAAAYLARCLGHADVTADQVKAWRAETRIHEAMYASNVLGARMARFTDVHQDEPERCRYWLGPHTRIWVADWLSGGWIAQVALHRIATTGHSAVLLDAADEGVVLMDPIYGHVIEPWSWFLGPGTKSDAAEWPGRAEDGRDWYGCTFVEGWYKP